MDTSELLKKIYTDLQNRAPKSNTIAKKYLLLSTPRSGSSFFCDYINKNTNAIAGEWLNPRYFQAYNQVVHNKNSPDINLNEYLQFVIHRTADEYGNFFVNTHISDAQFLLSKGFNILNLNFDKIYYIKRQDKIAQAVSLLKAELTDSWSHDTEEREYDNQKLNIANASKSLAKLVEMEYIYKNQLKKLTSEEFIYEEFTKDNGVTIDRFFKQMGFSKPTKQPTLKIQRNNKTSMLVEELKSTIAI